MTDKPTDLDTHRGLLAQKETERRRQEIDVQQDQLGLKARQDELEHFLTATPAANWSEAVEKIRFLLGLFSQTPEAVDPRRQMLIKSILDDFDHLLEAQPSGNDNSAV
jgi:hypothetical protein